MIDILKVALLFGIGGIAGFTNVMAGGGSSLTLPALIFMGLEPSLANGTNRIAIVIQNISAVASFRKNRIHRFKLSFQFALFTLPGAIIGAFLAVRVSDVLFQRILGAVLILITISMFFSRSRKHEREAQDNHSNKLIYLALFGIGFYGGFLQVGVGFLFMAALYHVLRLDMVFVNMHKVFIILIYTLPALLIFAITGNVNWKFGLILAAGNALGAWWGAHMAVKGGEKIIRIILAIVIAFMAFRLLFYQA
ncbi:MAG: sulfite exporter TauE/SafE family protein [Candidatus Aminicenantaceae bacterium]